MRIRFREKLAVLSGVIMLFSFSALYANKQGYSFEPAGGYVPNERAAVRIAEAVLDEIYGEEAITTQKPLRAKLVDRVWIVTGSIPEGLKGGVATIEIEKKTAKVIKVSHSK